MGSRWLRLAPLAPLALGAGLTAACGPAPKAGTVQVQLVGEVTILDFVALSGKANNVSVTLDGTAFLVTETGGITAGSGCTAVNATTARCQANVITARLDLLDGNDTANVTALSISSSLLGGTGNDRLTAGIGNDSLRGGEGDDTLTAGGGLDILQGDEGRDALDGGAGDDTLAEAGTAASTDVVDADTYTGGTGVDLTSYAPGTAPVTVTLDDVANDGRSAEGDNVKADVENLNGGSANDRFTGDADANVLLGLNGWGRAARRAGERPAVRRQRRRLGRW